MTPAPRVERHGDAGVGDPAPAEGTSVKRVLIAFAPLAVLGLLIALDVPVCPTKNFLGVPCPGCGLTRATEAMLTGDWVTMLRMHPLAPILAPAAIYGFVRASAISAGLLDRRSPDLFAKIPSAVWAVIGVALIGLWGLRLAGLLGGHPDGIDLSSGWIVRGFSWIGSLIGG